MSFMHRFLTAVLAASLVRWEVRRARTWFDRGLALLPLLDGRSAACVRAMTGIYRRILGRIERVERHAHKRRRCGRMGALMLTDPGQADLGLPDIHKMDGAAGKIGAATPSASPVP